MFFMDMTLGHTPGAVPAGEHVGAARQRPRCAQRATTLVSYSKTVILPSRPRRAWPNSVDAEVIDLRTPAA